MRNLDSLPFDVLFEVARYLSLDDVVALGCTSRQLRVVVKREEALCRMVVQNNAPFAREALLASQTEQKTLRATALASYQSGTRPRQQHRITSSQKSPHTFCIALQNIHARRAAFASASPRSACVIDYAADFLHSEGVLCYVYSQPSGSSSNSRDATKIRVINVEDGGREVAVLDVGAIAQSVVESAGVKEGSNGDDDERSSKRRRQEARGASLCWDAEEHAEMRFGEMAYRAAATLGFEAPLWEDVDASSSLSLAERSRSASLCSLAHSGERWRFTSSSSSTTAAYPLPRVTLVHCSASILSLYLNFSSSRSATSAPAFLRNHPHYLVAIRLDDATNSCASPSCLRVFRLPNRLGGYGSDDNFGADSTMSTSSEGEGDGAGRGLKLFVRNTDAYFYFGTHTGCGTRGERVWVVHGVSLKEGTPLKTTNNNQASPAKRKGGEGGKGDMAKLTMQQITSKALGADTSFFIHNGYFYGLTISGSAFASLSAPADAYAVPQDQLNDPHVSTYTSIRFPLESPTADAVETGSRVFRRHHGVEGPINDAWTALGAVVDETSGEARVIEERREWGQGMGTQGAGRSAGGERSWYFETLGFGEANDSSERGDDDEEEEEEEEEEGMTTSDGPGWDDSSSVSARSLSPTGSLRASAGQASQPQLQSLSSLSSVTTDPFEGSPLDAFLPDFKIASSDATRCRPWIRHPRRVHREHLHYGTSVPREGNGADALHSYTLSRTKSRAYNYSARTFLDLVEDEQCCPDGLCLRLRVGARRERTQRGDETQIVHEDRPGGGEMQRQDQVFVHKRVRMWPAASSSLPGEGRAGCRCSQNPHAIVNAPLQRCRTRSSFSPAQAVDIVAATDERSIVFLRRPKYGGGRGRTGPLVLLSFDEGISARGLDGLSWKKEQCCSCR